MSTGEPSKHSSDYASLIKEPQQIVVDSKAKEENRDYVSQARRRRREQNTLHWAFLGIVWIAVLGVAFVLFAKLSHLVLPPRFSWLDDAHLKKLDEFLTTGAIGGTVVGFFKSKFSDKNG